MTMTIIVLKDIHWLLVMMMIFMLRHRLILKFISLSKILQISLYSHSKIALLSDDEGKMKDKSIEN